MMFTLSAVDYMLCHNISIFLFKKKKDKVSPGCSQGNLSHCTGTGRTYGKLYGNEGSHESVIPKWYNNMFPNVPGVVISRY
jgi:hypothetical protein